MAEKPKGRLQRLSADAIAESKTWFARCPYCGYERSWYDMGGIMYKAAGNSRKLLKCPNCGRLSWHRVYRRTDPTATAPPPPLTTISDSRRRLRWVLGIGSLVMVVVLFVVLLFSFLGNLLQPVVTVGDSFMTALKNGTYDQAYSLCAPELQQQIGRPSDLAAITYGHQPARWSWSGRSIRNGEGRLDGDFTYADGTRGTVHLTLRQVGRDWLLTSFNLLRS